MCSFKFKFYLKLLWKFQFLQNPLVFDLSAYEFENYQILMKF